MSRTSMMSYILQMINFALLTIKLLHVYLAHKYLKLGNKNPIPFNIVSTRPTDQFDPDQCIFHHQNIIGEFNNDEYLLEFTSWSSCQACSHLPSQLLHVFLDPLWC